MAIFSNFFLFSNYTPGKCVLRYSRTKKQLSFLLKQKVQRVKKFTFFQRVNPCFWSKNGHFSNFFFRQYRPGNCVLRYSRTLKNLSRLWHFSMLLVQKWLFFQFFFIRQYRPGKCPLRYSRTKKHLSRL